MSILHSLTPRCGPVVMINVYSYSMPDHSSFSFHSNSTIVSPTKTTKAIDHLGYPTLPAHRTQPLGRLLLNPGHKTMLYHRIPSVPDRITWTSTTHHVKRMATFAEYCQSFLLVFIYSIQKALRSTHAENSRRRGICRSDRCRRTGRDRCHRRRRRACPSARSRRHSTL